MPIEVDPLDPMTVRCARCGLVLLDRKRASGSGVLGKMNIQRRKADEIENGPVMIGTAVELPPPPPRKPASVPPRPPPATAGGPQSRPQWIEFDAAPEPPRPPRRPRALFSRALLAEDLELHRTLIRDGLMERGLAADVGVATRGDEFVTLATTRLKEGVAPELVILDLQMPGLSGLHAAVALRAIERAFGRPPTPVLFFSARVCDDPFKLAMRELGSAGYLNKAADGGPAEFLSRLEAVLRRIRPEPLPEPDEPAAEMEIERGW